MLRQNVNDTYAYGNLQKLVPRIKFCDSTAKNEI